MPHDPVFVRGGVRALNKQFHRYLSKRKATKATIGDYADIGVTFLLDVVMTVEGLAQLSDERQDAFRRSILHKVYVELGVDITPHEDE